MLYLTYNNLDQCDGAGSQLQRIISIYMATKYYNIGYIHTPICNMSYYGLEFLETNTSDTKQIEQYNNLYNFESDTSLIIDEMINIKYIDHDTIIKYTNSDRIILLKITYAHTLIDNNTDILKCGLHFDWILTKIQSPIHVAIHLRRGELFVVDSDRMLPNSYYIDCMKALQEILNNSNIPFIFHLYTEIPTKSIEVLPSFTAIHNRVNTAVTIHPENTNLEDFKSFDSIIYHVNECPVKTLIDLSNSDILLASKSSYSYTAGLTKNKGIVLFHPFWHKLAKSWIPVTCGNDILNNSEQIVLQFKRNIL